MSWTLSIAMAAAACIVTVLATGALVRLLGARAILDHPNERSSHDRAVPRGGGIAVMAVIVAAWCLLAWPGAMAIADSSNLIVIALLAIALAGYSFLDDLRGLPALQRLLLQSVAVALGCLALPDSPVFQGLLPPVADRLAAGFVWLWFINLFNFMDGIDGIAGVEAFAIGVGIYAIGALFMPIAASHGQGLAIAAAMAGFLIWNWHPARIFLGDVGSIPLGFLLGWLLLDLAVHGLWHAALILPLYYLADASLTLTRRLLRGAAIWQAHREHCYQVAVQRGRSHSAVVRAIALTNLLLVGLAFGAAATSVSPVLPWLILAIAPVVVMALTGWMVYGGREPTGGNPA
ncbi:MAG: glycosyltransferase family 4 protein [Proteobacteria bacterium]|nr:glycosyltransferase family 4 protein [Pseudomonadota bacterium]